MDEDKKIPDAWLYPPILLLLANFIYRLIDQSQMLFFFPLDFNNDVSSYMAQLHFLDVCGFHNFCPYWYNGFITFKFSPPGWYFFAYPLQLLFQDVKIATYISLLIIFLLGFFLLYKLGKSVGFNPLQRIIFFALFFANASAIGNFIRLGRVNELLGWVLFIPFFFLFYYYKDKRITPFFYLSIPLYAAIILSYHTIGVLSLFLWLGFLLTRTSFKDSVKTSLSLFFGLLLSSFWLAPFLFTIFTESAIPHLKQGEWLWYFGAKSIYIQLPAFVTSLAIILLFYFYLKQKPSRSKLLFFLPSIGLGALFFLHLTPFFPVLNQIYPDPIIHYFLFFSIFFFLSLDLNFLPKKLASLVPALLIIITLISIGFNILHTPFFNPPDSQLEQEFIQQLSLVDGRFIMVGDYYLEGPFSKAFYSYAATRNIPSISGWYPEEKEYSYIERMAKPHNAFNQKNCALFKEELNYFNTTHVFTRDEFCLTLKECGLTKKTQGARACLYTI